MKKASAALLIGISALMLTACGASKADNDVSALPPAQEAVQTSEPARIETAEPAGISDSEVDSEEYADPWPGIWYEEKLGMEMTVTKNGNGYKYVVNWPDPDNNMTFVWEINGAENEGGAVYYSNGVASVIERDADGRETTSVLSDHERGNLAVLYDGTLLWIEEVEIEVEHVFTRK